MNFTIFPGEYVCFVGESGSGKSTTIKLLTRMYDVSEGQILIDDIPLKEINLQSLRK